MPRKPRVQFPGAIYHVMNRVDRREPIFKDDKDCQSFIQTLAEACGKAAWQVHAYCLLPNHLKSSSLSDQDVVVHAEPAMEVLQSTRSLRRQLLLPVRLTVRFLL